MAVTLEQFAENVVRAGLLMAGEPARFEQNLTPDGCGLCKSF